MVDLLPLVQSVRRELLRTRDSVCLERARLVTEAWRRHESDPLCLRRARAFAHVLRHMTLDVRSNPIFAGNTSSRPRAWMLIPEHGFGEPPQVLLENEGLDGIVARHVPDDLREFWVGRGSGGLADPGHFAVHLDRVVNRGLDEEIRRLNAVAEQGSEEQRRYRRAMRICLTAVIAWAHRYAAAAEAAAATETDPVRRACLARVATACRHVPAKPARTLFEGLQAIVLVQLALAIEGHGWSVSVGSPDRILSRFAPADPKNPETAILIAAFFLKLTANSIFGRGSKTQAITVGGAAAPDRDGSNALTYAFLEAANLARVGDPHLFLRWHPTLPEDLRERAAELLAAGLSMPLLINDEATVRGFIDAGVTPEEAWRYCVIGCNELGIPGLSAESAICRAGNILYLDVLNHILLEHESPDSIHSPDQLLVLLEVALARRLHTDRTRYITLQHQLPETAPVPLASALMDGCIEAGADMIGAMKYRFPGLYERQLANAVDALSALEHVVFRERRFTLSEVVRAMRENFASAGGRRCRQALLAAPRWGRDDPAADHWARRLLALREHVLQRIDREFGHAGHMVCHVVRSLHHLDGQRIAASPDGRLAGTPVGDSLGPTRERNASASPTAILNSVARAEAGRFYRGGTNVNLTLARDSTRSPQVTALIEGFFRRGGQELQINCLQAEQLRQAQRHPEHHGELVVRFAGLSSRFVDLSRLEQEEIIARVEAL